MVNKSCFFICVNAIDDFCNQNSSMNEPIEEAKIAKVEHDIDSMAESGILYIIQNKAEILVKINVLFLF